VSKPARSGRALKIRFVSSPRARQGKLQSGEGPGSAVHAGAFLRKREVVLDAALLASPRDLARILIHEIFHFVWLRLGNRDRRSFENLLREEILRGAKGELGWSAERRKLALRPPDLEERTRRWREYVCESFCDTAAWLFGGLRRHAEFTLSTGRRRRRRAWFCHAEGLKRISV
jgi:hypothetical protein